MAKTVNYKQIAASGLAWKFLEQIGSKMVAFVLSVVLARLLYPEDYGVIALTSIFITLCDVFVSSGFATSLIQKKDTDELDYSSVFYTSMAIALVLYAVLFFSAPAIAQWLDTPILCNVLRVLGLRVPISAFGSVQQAYATKNYMFKKFFLATMVGGIVSGCIGITMAYNGFGVWALVAHDLISVCLNKITLYFATKWRPHWCYSWTRTKSLFAYGWKVLACSLFETLCGEINSLIIGKKYSTEDLAYTSKGASLPKMLGQFTGTPIRFVLMPVLSAKQGEGDMRNTISSCISCCCYIVFPMMCGLAIVSPTLVPFLYTEKWNGAVVFMQLMCIYYAVEPLIAINTILIQANGKSMLYLIIGIIARVVGLLALLIAINFGVFWIVVAQVLTILVHYIIVCIPNGRLYGYNIFRQLKEIVPYVLLTAVMGVCVYWVGCLPLSPIWLLGTQAVSGVIIYLGLSIIFKVHAFTYLFNIVKSFLVSKKIKRTADISDDQSRGE